MNTKYKLFLAVYECSVLLSCQSPYLGRFTPLVLLFLAVASIVIVNVTIYDCCVCVSS